MHRTSFLFCLCALLGVCLLSACNREDNSLVTTEIRYENPHAGEVELAWGIAGWQALPGDMLPENTYIKDDVMHTIMHPDGDSFVAEVITPPEAVINYGFLVTKDQSGIEVDIWDGDYQVLATRGNATVKERAAIALGPADPKTGERLYAENCSVCHGAVGKGIPGLGLDLTTSDFVASNTDPELVDFISTGRSTDDPANTTGVAMPPRGGNAALSNADLQSIVAHLRTLGQMDQISAGEGGTEAENEAEEVVTGFTIEPYAVLPDKYLTSLEFGPDGMLYVLSYDGAIWRVGDKDSDGNGDEAQLYKDGFIKPVGIAWRDEELFIASEGVITVLRDLDADGTVDEEEVIVSGLPAGIHPVHANNDLSFGPDGRLYFGVGATADAAPETYEFAASILSVNADGTDLQVLATGVRNSYEVDFNEAGDMFATDNTPDSEPIVSTSPPEEFNQIIEGSDYGYPYEFGQPAIGSTSIGPVLGLPVRSAPAGMLFYYADQFPPEYLGNAFVALWGIGQVYRVQLAKTPDGSYVARGTPFAGNIPGVVDVAVGPEGSLYLSASENSTIYRVRYNAP